MKSPIITEEGAIIAVAKKLGITEAKVKSVHQELRSSAKMWIASRGEYSAEAENH